MHHQTIKQVKGALPCGNPKRYESRDVVRMPQAESKNKKKKQDTKDSVETESDRHLQSLLQHQIKTDVTVSEQISQHREFTPGSSHAPGVEKLEGVHCYKKYKNVEDLDAKIDYLRHCGLDDGEITLKLKEEMKVSLKMSEFGSEPLSRQKMLDEIERKIQQKEKLLQSPDTFKGALELSRQAMDLERSLFQRQSGTGSPLLSVISRRKKFEATNPDDPINHLPEILSGMEEKKEREPRRDRRKRRKLEKKLQYYALFSDNKGKCQSSDGNDDFNSCDETAEHNDHLSSLKDVAEACESTILPRPFKPSQSASLKHLGIKNADASVQNLDCEKNKACSGEQINQLHSPGFINGSTCDYQLKTITTADNVDNKSLLTTNSTELNDSVKIAKEITTPVVLLSRKEILNNRLSVEEMKAMDKFSNYTEGTPNKVVPLLILPRLRKLNVPTTRRLRTLKTISEYFTRELLFPGKKALGMTIDIVTIYIKNLPNKTTEQELVALFGHFQSTNKPKLVFRLLSGRMKGQAFITFPDEATATEAIQLVNGYKLRDKPVILSFSKKQ